jgi:hypothetical protein
MWSTRSRPAPLDLLPEGRGPYQLDHVFRTCELYDALGLGLVDPTDGVLAASDHAPSCWTLMLLAPRLPWNRE